MKQARRVIITAMLNVVSLTAQAPDLVPAPAAAPTPHEAAPRVFTLTSAILGDTRRISIALPASFSTSDPARRYPVVVVLDGGAPSAAAVHTAAMELMRHGLMPECIVVGVENVDQLRGRVRDLTPPGLSVSGSSLNEGGDRFLDFLERELLPAVDRQFRAAPPRTLVGHSSGGILATYAAATRSTFRLIVALDTPATLGDDWLAAKLIARAKSGPEPLRYASYAARFGWSPKAWERVRSAAPASWRLHQEQLSRESHASMPMLGAYLGLREVFADYSRLAAPEFPTTRILPYYDTLAQAYGGALEPPEGLLRDVVSDLLAEGRGSEARVAFDRLVSAYGEPRDAAATRAEIAEAVRRPPPAETVESLLGTPFPTPNEAAPYLGEWEGHTWMSPETRTPFLLRIRIEGGRVVGQLIRRPGTGNEEVQALEYLTVDREGFTYGFMNGMRPRGMILFTVRPNGNRFEGTMRWGGVSVRRPDGSPLPTIHVELTKRNPAPVQGVRRDSPDPEPKTGGEMRGMPSSQVCARHRAVSAIF